MTTTFADRQQTRRATGLVATADLLDRVAARSTPLRQMAERLVAAPDPTERDPVRVAGEMRRTIAAMRMLAARRQLAQHVALERDDPTLAADPSHRAHLAALTAWIRSAERTGTVPNLPWTQLLRLERRSAPLARR